MTATDNAKRTIPAGVVRFAWFVGLAGILLVATVAWTDAAMPTGLDTDWTTVALVWTIATASMLVPLRFHHAGGVQGFHLQTGAFVALLLLGPAHVAVAVSVLAAVVAHLGRSSSGVKLAFNVGQDAVWSAVAALAFRLVADGAAPLGTRALVAATVAVVVAELVNGVLLGELFRRLDERPLLDTVRDVLGPIGLLGVLGNLSGAVFLALLAERSPWLVVLAVPPLAGMFVGYRGYVRQAGERARAEGLQRTSRRLVDAATDPGALDAAISELTVLFQAATTRLVTRDEGTELGAVGAAVARTLATGRPERLDEPPSLSAPVVLDGHVVACVLVTGRRGVSPWDSADLALLSTVADEVGAALRTRDLLADVERERARLEVESTKLADIVGAASDGIALLSTDGVVRSFNPAMERLTGVGAQDAVGRTWTQVLLLRDDQGAELEADGDGPLHKGLVGRRRVVGAEVQLRRSDGEWRWLRWSSAPVEDDDGSVSGVVLVLQDRTREHEVEQLRADFVATVSHELRTPLTPLRGFLTVLRDRAPELSEADLGRVVQAMDGQVGRLETLISDLLVVAELQRGGDSVELLPVVLADAVREAVEAEVDAAREHRVQIDVPPRLRVRADHAGLVRVLRNLVSNGLKHTDGPVHVSAASRPDSVVLVVADEGPGIGRWGHDVVFEPFGRLGNHLHRTQGPGLGLAIARALAEGMGGQLRLAQPDRPGARFEVELASAGLGVVTTRGGAGAGGDVVRRASGPAGAA